VGARKKHGSREQRNGDAPPQIEKTVQRIAGAQAPGADARHTFAAHRCAQARRGSRRRNGGDTLPAEQSLVTEKTFHWALRAEKFKSAERRDGSYILRTNLAEEAPEILWRRYIQLTEIEAAFKCLKSDLAIRPVFHQLETRVEAHIFVAFLGYCLSATLRIRTEVPATTPEARHFVVET